MTTTDTNGTSNFGQRWRTGNASDHEIEYSYETVLHGQTVTVTRYKMPARVWIPTLSIKDRMNLSDNIKHPNEY